VAALELPLVDPLRPDAVLQLDLLRVRQLFPGKRARDGLERPHLRGEPAVVELGEELARRGGEALGLEARLVRHPPLELRRPVVEVDEVGLVPAEPQRELEVALRVRQCSKSAACPWPTPTQRVASP
jgi:hypothetical protein